MRLQVRSGADAGREITVDRTLTIGRSAANDVMLGDSDVSNYHARVRPVPGGVEVTDAGSRNGTFVNGQRLDATPVTVRPGDELYFANTAIGVVDELADAGLATAEVALDDATEALPSFADVAASPPPVVVAAAPQPPPPVVATPPPPPPPVVAATPPDPVPDWTPAAPKAESEAPARSLVVRAGIDTGRTLLLEAGRQYTIGRDPTCDLALTDPRVSSRHARVRLDGESIVVEDLQSANGTLLNGALVSNSMRGNDGSEVQAGESVLVFYARQRSGGFEPQPTIIGTVGAAAASSVAEAAVARKRSRLPMVLVGVIAVAALGAALAAIVLLTQGDDGDDVLTSAEIIELVRPSVVQVLAIADPDSGSIGTGTGSVVDAEEGLILTNNHVAGGAQQLLVLNELIGEDFNDAVEARLIASAPCDDLAIIQIVNRRDRSDLEEVVLGNYRDLRQGQEVIAMGFPTSAESGTGMRLASLSATQGIISRASVIYDSPGDVPRLEKAIQHQAAVNPGNSGGPLFDLMGRQIGVNTAIFFIPGRGPVRAEGGNYAISVERVEELLDDLKDGISPKWIGTSVDVLTLDGDPFGLGISGITPGSPADRAGLSIEGDVIVEIDGEPVFDFHTYCEAMPDGEDESVEMTIVNRFSGDVRTVEVDGIGRFDGE